MSKIKLLNNTMSFFTKFIILLFVLLTLGENGLGIRCQKEFLGITSTLECPGIFDDPNDIFCCGTEENRYCCDEFLGLDEEFLQDSIPKILGAIFAVAVGLIILCIVCCCCCPFCVLYKRRQRGNVHNPNPATTTMQPIAQPQSQVNYAPVQQPQQQSSNVPYPTQSYPTQPPPMQQGYDAPQQPYPPIQPGMPPASNVPYPSQGPYPTAKPAEQPPPYSEKQLAYNPNY